jgi:NAD(P)-dependent dehydrogenase (short-subunit alcohol dehydrogenase family)
MADLMSLEGRVVLVTGGNGGIGLGMADACARAGADVAIWGTNVDKNAAAEAQLKETGRQVLALQCDVGDEEQVVASFAETLDRFGKVDALFANAGIGRMSRFVDLTLELWRTVTRVNLEGAFLCFREAARHMVERGEGGSLVAISSVSAIHGAPMNQPYAASKAGLNAMIRGLAVELARYKIRCNSILPGWIETDMTALGRTNEKFLNNTTQRTPLRRWGVPQDLGPAAVFLANPDHLFHTGDCLVVDGGYSIF